MDDSHCRLGCTLGDIIGSPTVVFVLGWKIFGLFLFAKYVLNYARLRLLHRLPALLHKAHEGPVCRAGNLAGDQADTLSLTAFQVGLYGWMAIAQLVLLPAERLHPARDVYWFLIQIGGSWAS